MKRTRSKAKRGRPGKPKADSPKKRRPSRKRPQPAPAPVPERPVDPRHAPLRAIPRKPGRFYDPQTHKVYDISTAYEGSKYDTVKIPTTFMERAAEYGLVRAVVQKLPGYRSVRRLWCWVESEWARMVWAYGWWRDYDKF